MARVFSSCFGLTLLAGLTAGPAAAQTSPAAAFPVVAVNRQVALGFDGFHKAYKEVFPAGSVNHDKEEGWTPGLVFKLSGMKDFPAARHVYGSIEFSFDRGLLDYNGAVLSTGAPLRLQSGMTDNRLRAELGKGVLLTPRLMLIPVVQVGYQQWNREPTRDLSEDYESYILGAAVRADYALTPRLVGRARIGLAETFSPSIDINLDRTYPARLGMRPVYQASLGLDYALGRRLHLFTEADVDHYSFGRSVGVDTSFGRLFEPASRTTDLHLRAGVGYSF